MKRSFSVVAIVMAAAAATACGSSVETAPATATAQSAAAATKAPLSTPAHGPVKLAAEALSDVPLRGDQRAQIEALARDAEARHEATKQARVDLMSAIAAQVEAGKIDRAALQPKIDAAADAWVNARPADRAALEKLHAILDPGQRSAFVDALVARMRAHHGDHAAPHARLEKLAADLKLTDDQKQQIGQILRAQRGAHGGEAAWKEGHAKGKALLEAFKADRFVMDEVAPPRDARAQANAMADHVVSLAEQVLPVLTPEQRALAAAKLREHATEAADAPASE